MRYQHAIVCPVHGRWLYPNEASAIKAKVEHAHCEVPYKPPCRPKNWRRQ